MTTIIRTLGESLLNAGDRFKQYEAQQRIVSLVIESKDKMAVDFIIEFTMSAKSSGQMCLSMELLRDILVKRSPLRCYTTSKMRNMCEDVFKQVLDSSNGIFQDTTLYATIGVWKKLLAVVTNDSLEDNDASTILTNLINFNCEKIICDILLSSHVLDFVKRKLLTFFFKLFSNKHTDTDFNHAVINLANEVLGKLGKDNMLPLKQLLSREGLTTFIGVVKPGADDTDYHGYDPTWVREWTYLFFMCEHALHKNSVCESSPVYHLGQLDAVVREVVKVECQGHLFAWLPEVYVDQDDMWISVLDIILDLYQCPDKLCQHHYLFLQFVGIVGYDHVTLVDFLTSPETNFREYLVKYLEHLKQTWKPFMDCVDHFKKHERDEFSETENDSGNKDYGMTASDDEYASSVSDIPQSTSFTSTESNTPCMNEDTNITSSCSKKAALLTSGVSVSTAAGLGLIAGAYDSSSEEGEDVTDDVTTLSDNDISDISSDTRADALGADSNTFVHKAYQEVGGFAEVDYCETDKSEKDQTKDKGVLKADNDTDTDIINEPTEILLDIDLSGDSVLANGLLDDVMGMLIRTRLSLERLHVAHLLPYNPQMLVQLLENVESIYEQ
ncbi:uncharacterized protein LOC128234556 isoform X2 [Mya arenaria]|uniref:uncharacterized protein LOC128234556 isoform X2 n=1 Tax=Mya arenaria TaxID=6604 RepID=UPI0022E421FA|nr:uncharacterized protein LOC128234556 isoform X2 [Mya arenaria]XP_052804796.1 uncharacterized protein LOC128234556 isoform X2 [Mya arenaria]